MLHLLGIDHLRLTYRFQGRALTDVHGEVAATSWPDLAKPAGESSSLRGIVA
ncbi:MAG: hypothetical protein U0793_02275 [Gemmataceae bacterium]